MPAEEEDENDYSEFRDDMYKRRNAANHNIVKKLINRQIISPKPNTHFHANRSFCLNVYPNFTVVNVEKPPCFLRKFSPDGRHFVAFSRDQSSIEIYEFKGPCAVEELMFKACQGNEEEINRLKVNMFDNFFRKKAVVTVTAFGEHLNRECSLFTDDGKYVIVGSASSIPEDSHPLFFDIYQNNESVTPNNRSPLENYSIHIVDLYRGRLQDSRSFKCDKIVSLLWLQLKNFFLFYQLNYQ